MKKCGRLSSIFIATAVNRNWMGEKVPFNIYSFSFLFFKLIGHLKAVQNTSQISPKLI